MVFDFKSIFDLVQAFPTEESCIKHLEMLRWQHEPVSPFDPKSKVYKCAGNRYKCKNTGKYFNVKVGTIFEDTKIPLLKWFMALYVFSSHKKGISSHQLARDISVTQKTAWFLLHRLRYAFDHPNFTATLSGEVEIDETFIGGSEGNKHAHKKTENNQGRSTKTRKPVLGMKERGGNIVAQVVDDTTRESIEPIIHLGIEEGATVYTDEHGAYNKMNEIFDHKRCNHGAKEYVNGMAHTNGLENYWSHLKRGLDGIYHWCSHDHLQAYVNEFSLRMNTRKFTTADRFNTILLNMAGRLTYKTLIS